MQIYNRLPIKASSIYAPDINAVRIAAPVFQDSEQKSDGVLAPAVIIKISPQARALYEASTEDSLQISDGLNAAEASSVKKPEECQTCKSRKYMDKSNDPYASFQSPTHISPEAAFAAVSAHEGGHIANAQTEADKEGREVVSQSVRIHTDICSECGRVYVSGGEARTVTSGKNNSKLSQEEGFANLLKMLV